jgi:hypothetical protein
MTDESREQKMAEIKARAEALRAAKAAAGKGSSGSAAAAVPAAPEAAVPPAQPEAPQAAGQPAAPPAPTGAPKAPAGEGAELSREEKMAAIRARAEALKAARAGGTPAPAAAAAGPAAPAAPAATKPATVEVPVSSLNPGGRPGAPPQAPGLQAFGTINQSVEILAETGEADNLKKLLGGLGAYQNPLRGNVWQIDYRYYAEARRRLEAAGYTITEKDYLDRPIAAWNPVARGWTRVEP